MSGDQVRVGQVWQDNDKRYRRRPRFLQVTFVGAEAATCEAWYDEPGYLARTVRVRLDRFKPTSTGYRLVQDAPSAGGAVSDAS